VLEALELEISLTERLKEQDAKSTPSVMTDDRFKIYQRSFTEVIDRDKNYGSLLMKIK
jgi:hypothetical protein